MSWWNAKYKNDHGEYEITFGSKDYEKTKAVEKLCQAIIDKKVKSVEDLMPVLRGWISVEERLPEPHKLVLVYRPLMAKKVLVTSRHVLNGCEDWSNSGYDIKRNPCITHWMPLPKLPEVEV